MHINNGDLPAVPPSSLAIEENDDLCVTESLGLSKREHFAAMAMQGMLSNSVVTNDYDDISEWLSRRSVKLADALLTALQQSDKDKS